MKIKLAVTLKPGDQPIEVITNLLCITEWERTEGRKISDGRGVGMGDMVAWAYFMFKQSGRAMKETKWQEWLQTTQTWKLRESIRPTQTLRKRHLPPPTSTHTCGNRVLAA